MVSVMSVRTSPGLISSTTTPVPSRAAARMSVRRPSPAFDVPYADQLRPRRVPHPAAEVQHPAAAAGHHRRQHRVGEQERPAQVGLDHPPPVVRVGLPRQRGRPLSQPRVAHQQVDRAEVAGHRVHRGPDLVAAGHVGGHGHRAATGRRDLAAAPRPAGRGCDPADRRPHPRRPVRGPARDRCRARHR